MHSDHILHTNLSPKSILLGRKLSNVRLYLIGFKYSVRLLPNTHMEIIQESIEDRADTRAVDLFSSVNKCLNILQAKKDDLESILYILLYLIRGGRLSDRLIEKEGRFKSLIEINRWKATTSADIICENLPSCFAQYLSYIRALGSQDRPNYSYLRSLFSKNFTNKKLGDNLGQLIAYDIVKILATHKSRSVSEANSVCKVTMASEKMLPVVDVEDDLSEDFVAKLPGINTVHSMKEIHWKNNQSELDEEDNEAYNTQSVSSKMEILSQYEAPLQNPLNSAKKISLSYNLPHKVAIYKDNKNNDKTNIKETQSKDDTDLAETKRHEDKESLDEFFNKSHSVQFMVRHARPK